jgi:hypothetical protein
VKAFDLDVVVERLNRLGERYIFTPEDLIAHYTEGDCWELALGLCRRYGWPVYILAEGDHRYLVEGTGSGVCHAVAKSPVGFVDILGVRSERPLREEWRSIAGRWTTAGPRVYLSELPYEWRGVASYFEDNWFVEYNLSHGSITHRVLDSLHPQLEAMGAFEMSRTT